MKFATVPQLFVVCLLSSLCAISADSGAVRSHPIGKVIKLIEGLQTQVTEQGKTEAVAYQEFEHWCKTSSNTISAAITHGKQETAKLKSKIEAGGLQEKALDGEIRDLRDELDKLDAQGRKADGERKKMANRYSTTQSDLNATITSMESAVTALKESESGSLLDINDGIHPALLQIPEVQGAVARLQASANAVSPRNSNLTEFLAVVAGSSESLERPELQAKGDHAKHVQPYSFKSGNVIELLKNLKLKFEDELVAATTEETNSLNAYALAKQARSEMISSNGAAKTEKETTRSDLQGDISQRSNDLKSTSGDLEADQKTEAKTKTTCATRAQEWEQRCTVRDEELKAMAKAISILDKAGGVQTGPPKNPALPPAPAEATSFLQIVSPREKALDLLRTAARSTHSAAMERLVNELTLRPNSPFDEVNNMIQKMIFRLMDEQKEEDKHKDWCDQEVSKTDKSAEAKTDKVGELADKLEEARARLQKLATDIKSADEMVADLTTFMKEAAEIRKTGKHENAAALKDAQDAQSAIADATAVLKDFYKKSGMVDKEPYEFVQRGRAPVELEDPAPSLPEYKGTPQATNIISLLETAASEFAQMEADTRAQEATDQDDFENEMQTSKIEQTRRAKESETKSSEKKNLVEKIAMLEKNKKHVQGDLDMVKQYLKDLRPACVEGASEYDDRKAARSKEADALRQSQGILADAFKEQEQEDKSTKFLEIRRHE